MTSTPGPPYDWDENKSRLNFQSRGFGFDLIHHFGWNNTVSWQDLRFVDENRQVSIGPIKGSLHVAVWTLGEGFNLIISLRKANRREAIIYARAGN